MDEDLLSRLIGHIYAASTDDDKADVLASALADAFDSESCLLYFARQVPARMPEISGILAGTENFSDWALSAYVDYYHERNVWYERGWRKGVPTIVLGQELIDTPALMRTEWSDYLRATDTLHVLGVQYRIADDNLGLIGIHRAPGRDAFDESDRRKMALLLPHFQRAMQIREQLALSEHRGALSLDLLDRLSVAVVLVAADGCVLVANRKADQLLKQRCGLIVLQGRLRPQFSGDAAGFGRLVAEATRTDKDPGSCAGGMFYLTMPLGRKQPVLIAPMRSELAGAHAMTPSAAIIFAGCDPERHGTVSYFMRRYALTPAEARLLSGLICGQDLGEYAEGAGVGIGTVKTHLKSLFTKTGCHRQSDLVRTILSDPLLKLIS